MILKNGSFREMELELKTSGKEIIIFGAGMIGTVTTPMLLKQYELKDKLRFYIDNDPLKWKNKIALFEREYSILSPDKLKLVNGKNTVILLTISRFSDVILQLNKFENLKNTVCYIIPMMCITNYDLAKGNIVQKEYQNCTIPKVIHYMWLGGGKISESLQCCIDSWKKYCPDYEIRCWDESNYDIKKNIYMRQAYEAGMYGFVPDYARLDILYTYGGIYLDTDVELIKNLDDMLYQDAFCCVEKWQTVNFGGGSGSVRGNKAIEKLIKARENIGFIDDQGNLNRNTCGYYDTLLLKEYGYSISGNIQKVLDLNIYPYEVFHPYDYMSGQTEKSINTHGIHHFSGGWLDEKMREANKQTMLEYEKVYKLATAEVKKDK